MRMNATSIFVMDNFAPISQDVTILFSWPHGMGIMLYSQMFYVTF